MSYGTLSVLVIANLSVTVILVCSTDQMGSQSLSKQEVAFTQIGCHIPTVHLVACPLPVDYFG